MAKEAGSAAPLKILDIPLFLKAWIALQVIAFVLDPLLDPRGVRWVSVIPSLIMVGALGYGLVKHSRTAWVLALLLSVLALWAGAALIQDTADGFDRFSLDAAFSLLFGAANLALLLSGQVRDWIKQPTVRRWDP